MMTQILRDVTVVPEGDGVDVKRLFPLQGYMNFDPFVLWDHFDIGPGRGFSDHPHRGFEAITYMFQGGMNHKDNLGNESFVTPGGAQRFTAGRGMVHSEMPAEEGYSNGIQLWINLPKRLKQIAPSYQQVDDEQFPLHEENGVHVKTLVGEGSPLELNTEVLYQHIKLTDQARYNLDIKASMRGIVYILKGQVEIDSTEVTVGEALFIEDQQRVEIVSQGDSELIICFGEPHNEPIYQHGPFVD
jgi:quercetin 2,3-dioxygenase